jgi:hypothetical protein
MRIMIGGMQRVEGRGRGRRIFGLVFSGFDVWCFLFTSLLSRDTQMHSVDGLYLGSFLT